MAMRSVLTPFPVSVAGRVESTGVAPNSTGKKKSNNLEMAMRSVLTPFPVSVAGRVESTGVAPNSTGKKKSNNLEMAMRSVLTPFPVSVAGRLESTRVATCFSKVVDDRDSYEEPPAKRTIWRRIYQIPMKFIKDIWEELKKDEEEADKKSGGKHHS